MTDHGIAVFEFAGVVDVDGHGGELLHHVLSGHAGVAACAGGDDVDPPDGMQFLARDVDFVEANQSVGERNAGFDGATQGIGLLKNLSY